MVFVKILEWLLIAILAYAVVYFIYKTIKSIYLTKKLEYYNKEKILYQNKTLLLTGAGWFLSYFSILTNKRLYLISLNIIPSHWKIDNKSIKGITYKKKRRSLEHDYYQIRINNQKKHIIGDKKELDIFFKKLKSINPKIKFVLG